MVANKRFGLSSKVSNRSLILLFSVVNDLICDGLREKNAISDPEIKADKRIRTSIATKLNSIGNVRGFKTASAITNKTSA